MRRLLNRADVDRFRILIATRLGLHYDDGRLDSLADVLRQRLDAVGDSDFEAYVGRLNSTARGAAEFRALAEQLTVTETFFFRYTDHFRAAAERVLPERIAARNREKRLRILSAGCSSGEEAYSLAVLVRESLPDPAAWDVKIVAIDVNTAVLRKAAEGRYSAWSLRATSEEARERYFQADGRDFVFDPGIRKLVTFEERNLVKDDPQFWHPHAWDVVFCRNVLMYFTPDAAQKVVRRISSSLVPGGFLFLGHAETLRGLAQEYHLCHTHETFYYQRRGAADASIVTPGRSSASPGQIAAALPETVEGSASWVDVIQQASERIASLAKRPASPKSAGQPTAGAAVPRGPSWNLSLVLEAIRREHFSDALELLQALPPDSHHDPDALLLQAVVLTNTGQLEKAEAACTSLLEVDELNAGAHYLMALCREHAGDLVGAMEHDRMAAYLDAGFAMPHLHLGILAKRSWDLATARRELGQALLLLAREDSSRLLMFGGGFSRETLVQLCRTELRSSGGDA